MTKPAKEAGEVGPESNPVTAEPVSIATDRAYRQSISGGGGGSTIGERIARLEGVFESFKSVVEGIRHAQNLMLGLVSLLALILIGLSVYELQRLDQMDANIATTNQRITDLPSNVSHEVRDLTQTLAATITAARQPAPAPASPPQQAVPAKPKKRP